MNSFANHVKQILAKLSDNPSPVFLSKTWELSSLKMLLPLKIFKIEREVRLRRRVKVDMRIPLCG